MFIAANQKEYSISIQSVKEHLFNKADELDFYICLIGSDKQKL